VIAGQRVTPTLSLVRLLGQGGMGSVWVAHHSVLATDVAVKFLSATFAREASLIERFQREAQLAAQIKSPHVVSILDHGVTADGVPYIAMELLEGEDLAEHVRRLGPRPPRDIASILRQVAKALSRAHQLGIVHRDIKPANIFIIDADGDLFAKVLDFGIAKQRVEGNGSMTATGAMIGTPLYMSPEQLISTKDVDFRSDLWSLGVVAYYAMTGKPPFSGETLGAISVAVHDGKYIPASEAQPGIPAEVDAWFQRALCRDPAGRFSSAKEMAEALSRAVGGTSATDRSSADRPSSDRLSGDRLSGPGGTLVIARPGQEAPAAREAPQPPARGMDPSPEARATPTPDVAARDDVATVLLEPPASPKQANRSSKARSLRAAPKLAAEPPPSDTARPAPFSGAVTIFKEGPPTSRRTVWVVVIAIVAALIAAAFAILWNPPPVTEPPQPLSTASAAPTPTPELPKEPAPTPSPAQEDAGSPDASASPSSSAPPKQPRRVRKKDEYEDVPDPCSPYEPCPLIR
jgi:eukaryotic-like serine/threonine-protein kinase